MVHPFQLKVRLHQGQRFVKSGRVMVEEVTGRGATVTEFLFLFFGNTSCRQQTDPNKEAASMLKTRMAAPIHWIRTSRICVFLIEHPNKRTPFCDSGKRIKRRSVVPCLRMKRIRLPGRI